MLDLAQLTAQIGELADETKRRIDERGGQLSAAQALAETNGDAWLVQKARIELAKTSFLAALPLDDHPIATAIDAPPAPAIYTAIATDGSQIPLDRHAAASCYVLNIGEVVIHYGTGARPHLSSNATLHFRDADLLIGGETGEASYINEQTLATRRLIAEIDAAQRLIDKHKGAAEAIALLDGTLILWAQEAAGEAEERETVARFMGLLHDAQSASMPIAGYLSRPGSREVVNALRIMLCPGDKVSCKPCIQPTPRPCDSLNRLSDAQLFAGILKPGQRSGLFESQSKVIDSYDAGQRIAFFYLNVGAEIARVEVPMWVIRSTDLLNRTHALILDQARKGHGYPVTLMEAHEQAVVRGPERATFEHLVESALIRTRLPLAHSRKAVAKRTRTL